MFRPDAGPPVAEVRPNFFTLLIANCALPSVSTPQDPCRWLVQHARAALDLGARPVVLVLPARGGPRLGGLEELDLWILRDDGSSTADAALRAAGEAFDEIPRRFAGALLVLASSPPSGRVSCARLLDAASRSVDGIACDGGHWPIAATREALVEMALRGVERTLRMRVTAVAERLVEQSRSGRGCNEEARAESQ